jgi:hypothetical protein
MQIRKLNVQALNQAAVIPSVLIRPTALWKKRTKKTKKKAVEQLEQDSHRRR